MERRTDTADGRCSRGSRGSLTGDDNENTANWGANPIADHFCLPRIEVKGFRGA